MNSIKKTLLIISLASMAFAGRGVLLSGGLNMSSTDQKEETGMTLKMRPGFNAGAAFEYPVTDQFSLVPGLSVETRGEKMEASFLGLSINAEMKSMYVHAPILAQFNVPAGPVGLGFFAGPDVGFLLSAEVADQDVKDDMNALDFGLTFGAGVEIPAGPGSIVFRPSYYLGILNAADAVSDDPGTPTEDESAEGFKNRNIKVQLAYKIHI